MSQVIKDLISNYTAGENLTANDSVYISDGTGVDSGRTAGRVYKLEIGTAGRDTFAGFSKQTVSLGEDVRVITNGRLKGFSGLPIGSVVYADAVAGDYTSSKPSSNVQVLGSVESATVLIVNASLGAASSNLVDGALVGTTDAQVITNKTQDDEILIKELAATPSTPAAGYKKIYPKTDGSVYSLNSLGAEEELGSGGGSGGGLDAFITEDFETTGSGDMLSGKNAAFDGGGVLGGVLADETSSQIAGTRSLKYTTNGTATNSDNDYFYLPAHTLDAKQKGQDVGVNFYYNSSIADDLMEVVIWDDTNNVKLNSSLDLLKLSSDNKRYSTSVFIPSDCSVIKVGFQHVGVSESSKVLIVDDIEISTNPFVYKDLLESQSLSFAALGSTMTSTTSGSALRWGTLIETGSNNLSYDDATGRFTANKKVTVNMNSILRGGSAISPSIYLNGSIVGESENANAGYRTEVSFNKELDDGDYIHIQVNTGLTTGTNQYLSITGTATTEHIISPAKSNMSDWTSYAPTTQGLGSLVNSSFQWRRVGDSIEIIGEAQTGTVSAVEAQIELPNNYVIGKLSNNTSVIGHLGRDANTAQLSKILATNGDSFVNFASYDGSSSDSITANLGTNILGSGERFSLICTVPIEGWSSNASFLVAVPIPKVAYIKDVKPSGTAGGTFTSGAWRTRDLNTLEGDSTFISLSTNQFTLQPGKYSIEAEAPAYIVSNHQCKLRNITDSSDDGIGTGQDANTSGLVANRSLLLKTIEITSVKSYELQHRCNVTRNGDGFGGAVTFGVNEIFTQVKITRLR